MNFIALQNSYDDVQIGLFTIQSTESQPLLADQISISKIDASKFLVPSLEQFCRHHAIILCELPFIAVNQGPGPFTTLRVVIATVNGISFASGIPLIGVNALHAAALGWQTHSGIIAILFNGFANDLYFLILDNGKIVEMGCKNSDLLLTQLAQLNKSVTFIGNGTTLHRAAIESKLGIHAHIPTDYPAYSSLEQIAALGYQSWLSDKAGSRQLLPLYFKNHPMQDKAS